MIHIFDKQKCCGCTACANVCPKHCIEMRPDEEGFSYPVVDTDICIGCNLCEKVCPIMRDRQVYGLPDGYIVRGKDLHILNDSTSGGAFTIFAEYVLNHGGIVFGAGYDNKMNVVCKSASNLEDLSEMRGSKFVQSQLGDTFSKIKSQLKDGRYVMFSGTPCQVSGLLHFLGEKPDNLICLDFVCRGVPSPKLWKSYLDSMQKKFGSSVVNAKFRNKTYGYHSSTMKLTFKNGKEYYGSGRVDPYMKAFVREMSSRPSCSSCAFKGIQRESDITLFDCKNFSQITGVRDDDLGYTSLFLNSEKAKKIFQEVKSRLITYQVSVAEMVKMNGIMVCNSAKPSTKREEFYQLANTKPITEAMQEVSPITYKDHVIECMKSLAFKTGFIGLVRRLKPKETISTNK